jgi:hypothetical protein
LIVAGGGAAAGSNGGGNLNTSAQGQITTFGGSPGSRGGGSGTNGGGGTAGRGGSGGNTADGFSSSYASASGGAGFYGSGGEAASSNSKGLKWSLGMLGGASSSGDSVLVGGFGGAAGAAAGASSGGVGGAGGYSGGGGSYNSNSSGQGGGSFTTSSFSGTNITATQGFNSGHGSVSVTLISVTESYTTQPSSQNVNEGSIVRFRTNTVGVANTTLYYTISGSAGINNFDFTDNALTGSFNTVSGVGTTAKTLSNDLSVGEGTETFYMNVSTGSTLGPVVATSAVVYVYDTSNAILNITPSVEFLNEGSSVGFAVTTTNIPDNTTVYYTISGSAGINTTDFTDGALSGSFNIASNSATVTKTLVNDLSSNEGTETFNMRILVGSLNGQIATTSSNVTIYDTSISPYVVTPSTLNVNEGSSVIFTTTTTAIPDTTLYYNIAGSAGISASDFTSNSLTGSFPLISGVGSTTLTLVNDTTTEGTETFYMNVRTGNPSSGPIVGVSSSVNINDTSLTPSLYDFTSATFTPGGKTGRTGPTLAQAISGLTGTGVDAWKNNTAFFNTTNGIQLWTVPITGTYRIEAFGAQGGQNTRYTLNIGYGASIRGDFILTKGEIIRILVGQQGISLFDDCASAGGGGGTFVVRTPYNTNGSILLIAGGGGGNGTNPGGAIGGTVSNTGTNDGNNSTAGGSNGNGGNQPLPTPCAINYVSGSGGGFFSNGGGPAGTPGVTDTGGGFGFVNGGNGGDRLRGADGRAYLDGSFGGGGMGNYGGGGGGGYSGGGGGQGTSCTCGVWYGGGGGGSYNNGTNRVETSNIRTGNGQVIITLL